MHDTILVTCGKPVVKLKYRTIYFISICSFLGCTVLLLYSLNLLLLAIKIRTNLGVYIEMISKNGDVFPTLLAMPTLITIIVNPFIMYYIMKSFSVRKGKSTNKILFVLVITCLVLICILFVFCVGLLSHTYSSYEDVHDGIITAMSNYSKETVTKELVDKMQVEYECCGSKNYTDWYSIKWFDANLINTE